MASQKGYFSCRDLTIENVKKKKSFKVSLLSNQSGPWRYANNCSQSLHIYRASYKVHQVHT